MSELATGEPLFASLRERPADGLLALMLAFRADPRPNKIDLGLGVYRDEHGVTPVMRAVKAAERLLIERQETKVYLGVDGDLQFVERLAPIVFASSHASDPRLIGMQTPGGTGALRLAAELIAATGSEARIWYGEPTWANHVPIFRAAGVETVSHRFYDPLRAELDLAGMLDDLDHARVGDAVLLHGCCHNPAGVDFTIDQWRAIADVVKRRRLIPVIDLAYQGLGRGLAEDAAGLAVMCDEAEAVIVAYSCDKNFGLYRERTGALWVRTPNIGLLDRIRAGMRNPARASWSMPPDHGAAVVKTILESEELTKAWRDELEEMRCRILVLRRELAGAHPDLAPLLDQTGMFAMLPIDKDAVRAIRRDHAIYLADDGRANLAGLQPSMIAPLVEAVVPYLRQRASADRPLRATAEASAS